MKNGMIVKEEFDFRSTEKQPLSVPLFVILETEAQIEYLKQELTRLSTALTHRKQELNCYLGNQLKDGEALVVPIGDDQFVVQKGLGAPIISKVVR